MNHEMAYRRVGASGLVVSEIALGSWLTYGKSVDDDVAGDCIRAALDAGITFFDTANVYNAGAAEEVLGRHLAGLRRDHLVVATKAFFPMSDHPNEHGLSRKHLHESLDASLKRMRMDYVDLFQCHRFDPDVPIAETVRAMDDLVRAGKTLYWGVSCWSAEQMAEANRIADATNAVRPISNQPQYSMLVREIEESVLPWSHENGIGQVVFSPLAEGLLTGKYARGQMPSGSRASDDELGQFLRPKMTDDNVAKVDRLLDVAERMDLPLSCLALAWTLRHPGVASAIVGASRVEQVQQNVRAAGLGFAGEVLAEIEEIPG